MMVARLSKQTRDMRPVIEFCTVLTLVPVLRKKVHNIDLQVHQWHHPLLDFFWATSDNLSSGTKDN